MFIISKIALPITIDMVIKPEERSRSLSNGLFFFSMHQRQDISQLNINMLSAHCFNNQNQYQSETWFCPSPPPGESRNLHFSISFLRDWSILSESNWYLLKIPSNISRIAIKVSSSFHSIFVCYHTKQMDYHNKMPQTRWLK